MLPGPMVRFNAQVDAATRPIHLMAMGLTSKTPLEQAQHFHHLFHVNARTLQHKFKLTRAIARNIVLNCPSCIVHLHPPHTGVNPRGLTPLRIWQMDVTHVPEFGSLKYVHVSVDTCSGIIHATPLAGEKVTHVITHCLEAWAAWGKPHTLKTDNGPAYTAKTFLTFCQRMEVTLIHGLPYNPQGQGIVERAHRMIKESLLKQKEGIGQGLHAKQKLSLTLFTLNFLNLNDKNHSAADRHQDPTRPAPELVKWKDVLTGHWQGPDPVLMRARGAVCVFPEDQENPLWVPDRLTRKLPRPEEAQIDHDKDGEPVSAVADAPAVLEEN